MREFIIAVILGLAMGLSLNYAFAGEFSDSAAGIENQLNSIQQDLTTIQNQMGTLPTDITDIQADLGLLRADIQALTDQIDVLLANDSELRGQIQGMSNNIAAVGTIVTELSDLLDDHITNHPTGGDDGNPNILPIQPLVLSPTDDAYVRGGIHADSNFGSSANLIVKSEIEGDFIRYSYLKFDLSGIRRPVDSTLLRIYAFSIQQDMTIELYDTTNLWNWTEDTITWNTKPNLGVQLAVSAPLKDESYIVWDLTSYINSRPSQTQFSFAIIAGGEAQASRNDFYSKESLINQPQVTFVWQEQGAMIDAGNCGMYVGDRVEDIRRGFTGIITSKKCLTLAQQAQWDSTMSLKKAGLTIPWARPIGIYKVLWDEGTLDSNGDPPYGGNNGYNLCPEGLCDEQCNYKSWDDNRVHKISARCRGLKRHVWTPLPAIYQVADIPSGGTTNPPVPPDPSPECAITENILPGTVQAEDYVAYNDTTPGNTGGAYRNDDVDIKTTPTSTQIGWVSDGEWLEYPICNIKPGIYQVWFRISCGTATCGDISMFIDGVLQGKITVPSTGSWNDIHDVITFQGPNVIGPDVSNLKIEFSGGRPLDLDYIEFEYLREHSNWPSEEQTGWYENKYYAISPEHPQFAIYKVLWDSGQGAPKPPAFWHNGWDICLEGECDLGINKHFWKPLPAKYS